LWMLVLLMPAEVSSNFMMPLLASPNHCNQGRRSQ